MALDLTGLVTVALLGALPLVFSARVEDVFVAPWRAGLCVWFGFLILWAAWRSRKDAISLSLDQLPWALFFLWALAATFWSANPSDSFRRTLELTGAVGGFWLGSKISAKWHKYAEVAILAAVASSLYAALQVLGLDWLPWSTHFGRRAFGTLANPDYYAGHLLLVLPLIGATLLTARGAWLPRLLGFLLLGTGLIFSQVRGAWLAAAGAAILASFQIWRIRLDPASKQRLKLGLAGAGALLLLCLTFSPDIRERVAGTLALGGYDATGRRYLWTIAASMIREYPLTGLGMDGFKFAFPRFQIIGVDFGLAHFRPYNYSEHAHNEILQFAAEMGIIGAGLFLWGLLAWGWRWQKYLANMANSGRPVEWWGQLGIGVGISGAAVYSAVNFPFQITPTAILWWIMLGASQARLPGQNPVWRMPLLLSRFVAGGLTTLALLGCFLSLRDLVGSGYYQRLRGLGEQGKWQQAIYYGSKARILLPHDYRPARWLSVVAISAGEEDLAERNIAARLRLHPYLADARADRAALAKKMGRLAQAEALYQDLLAQAPNFASGWGELGTLYFERGDFRAAADAFGQAAYYQENDPAWPHNQASALGQLKLYEDALRADTEAIRRDPGFEEAYVGLALSARALGRREEARAAARKALSLNPEDRRAYRLLLELEKK